LPAAGGFQYAVGIEGGKQMHRFLVGSILVVLGSVSSVAQVERMVVLGETPPGFPTVAGVRQITHGPKAHFFGYYGMPPWDPTGRYLVCLESDFDDRLVAPGEKATILLVDLEKDSTVPLAQTSAWNFQQGAMLHWLNAREIIFNDRVEEELRGVVLNVFTKERRVLPRAIAAMSLDGRQAACLSFARLAHTRPGYGYVGAVDPYKEESHPKEEGLHVMDVATGESRMVVSLDQIYHLEPVPEDYRENVMWMNHVIFSRDGERLFFLGRFKPKKPGPLVTAAFTVNTDGTDLRCILPYAWGASHFDWGKGREMVVTSRFQEGKNWLHVFFEDGMALEDYTTLAADKITNDGHCHFSYDGKWMVSDSYPKGPERMRSLYLIETATGASTELARFHEPKKYRADWRCDLHPRWSRDNSKICIDSTNQGIRQLFVVDLKKRTP
jgi:hypothetical protein